MIAATFTREHLVRDLVARMLDRLSSQSPRAADILDEMGLSGQPRLAAGEGLVLQGPAADPAGLARQALEAIGQGLGRSVKENPPATDIRAGDLVLLRVGPDEAAGNGKALCARLDRQLQALGRSGALAALAFQDIDAWPVPSRQKILGVLHKHACPRLFACHGLSAPAASPTPPWLDKCQRVAIGEESPGLRRRPAP